MGKFGLRSKQLAILIILSALGGISSLIIGYAGSLLSLIPVGSPAVGQSLAGLHVVWLVLVIAIVRIQGAATMAGALKGLVESFLPNHLGPLVFFISLFQGLVMDAVLLPFGSQRHLPVLFASGLASASNVFVLQLFQLLPKTLPLMVYAGMYAVSFASGLVLGGYLGIKTLAGSARFLSSVWWIC
ncbi:MAG: ECF transporter S component [Candidatus Bathyarchaeota archaeon]|nr:ECF transporter S component [Candidatus Bathyarchaeota archaeon]